MAHVPCVVFGIHPPDPEVAGRWRGRSREELGEKVFFLPGLGREAGVGGGGRGRALPVDRAMAGMVRHALKAIMLDQLMRKSGGPGKQVRR